MKKIVTNLWANDGTLEERVDFYVSLFEESRIVSSAHFGPDAGEYAGQKMVINFELQGRAFAAINGGDTIFTPNESTSFAVPCDTQEEIDRLWGALTEGGEPGPCGWLKDRYGYSWQIYPTVLDEMMSDPDPEKVQRVVSCFMELDRQAFDLEELQAAYQGS